MPSLIDEQTQFTDTDGLPIVNGSLYIGTQNSDPVANPITIYSDRDLTTPISNPQSLDSYGRSTNKIFIPAKYSLQVNNSASVQKYQALDAGDVTQTGISVLSNVQGTNTITAEGSPAIAALVDQQQYNFTTAGANTGAVTLQIDLTAAKSILKLHDVALVSGDLEANQIVSVVYNATDDVFELVSNVVNTIGLIAESADHLATPTAGFGEVWVRDDTPNILMFTDDTGNDFPLVTPVLVNEQATTTGTSFDFTTPSRVKKATIMFRKVSTDGSASINIQLGDSGGVEATGYTSGCMAVSNTAQTHTSSTIGFVIGPGSGAWQTASRVGTVTLYLQDIADQAAWGLAQDWVASGIINDNDSDGGTVLMTAGHKQISDTLTTIRIVSTDTFDAGAISIQYE